MKNLILKRENNSSLSIYQIWDYEIKFKLNK